MERKFTNFKSKVAFLNTPTNVINTSQPVFKSTRKTRVRVYNDFSFYFIKNVGDTKCIHCFKPSKNWLLSTNSSLVLAQGRIDWFSTFFLVALKFLFMTFIWSFHAMLRIFCDYAYHSEFLRRPLLPLWLITPFFKRIKSLRKTKFIFKLKSTHITFRSSLW